MSDYFTEFDLSLTEDGKGAEFDETDDSFSVLEARSRYFLRKGKSLCWSCKGIFPVKSTVQVMAGGDIAMSVCKDCLLSGLSVDVSAGYEGIQVGLSGGKHAAIKRLK